MQRPRIDILVPVHDASAALLEKHLKPSLEILDEDFVVNLGKIFSDNNRLGLVGVIGALSETWSMWWAAGQRAGRLMHGPNLLDFGNLDTPCRTDAALIDGCFMATNKTINWDIETYGEGGQNTFKTVPRFQSRGDQMKNVVSDASRGGENA